MFLASRKDRLSQAFYQCAKCHGIFIEEGEPETGFPQVGSWREYPQHSRKCGGLIELKRVEDIIIRKANDPTN